MKASPSLDERPAKGYTLPMRYYPLFLSLADTRCLVVGAGPVGRRKIVDLLACRPAELLVVDPAPDEEALMQAVHDVPAAPLRLEKRGFLPEDVENRTLVFAATPSAAVNSSIAGLCRSFGIPCNVAGPLEEGVSGSFLVPAHVENGPITLALSTGGCSPALARALKEDLRLWLQDGYVPLALLLKKLRPRLIALGLGSDADAAVFRAVCARPLRDELMDALSRRDADAAAALLRPVLPDALSSSLQEIIHELD